MNTAIFYSYKDFPDSSRNLKYFLDHGLPNTCSDFYLTYDNDEFLPRGHWPDNAIRYKVPFSIDFVDYNYMLSKVDCTKYQYFIFMNSSCVGPILPPYHNGDWLSDLQRLIVDNIHCVGSVAEIPPDNLGSKYLKSYNYVSESDVSVPFIHTYFIMIDSHGLKALRDNNFFSHAVNKDEAIHKYERLMTALILNTGYDITVLQNVFKGYSFLDKSRWNWRVWTPTKLTCPEVPGNYCGTDLNPYEVMFFKNIRHPNAHRDSKFSGISESNYNYLNNVIFDR